jgi:hypothetical protein
MRFAHVTSLRVEGNKTHILCKSKTLPTPGIRQGATKYCRSEIMFTAWTVYALLPATPPAPPIIMPFTSNGSLVHIFIPTTVRLYRNPSQKEKIN